ncbi:Iron hydrogenase maturase HydF [Carpediemonas membranifera]|uniref:Iron hydrogenase maturase HydF n=1 Tax=Carpediemonas membranifera TaxID=201153 RepID=A0A8J6AYM8_9EUKA|nr:Iron hydrogenase maturase HydF [Carpediemonas membranifera]|eukprot:KAG9397273.1 Iron hydrogenase maturase HydF [Carpediemonas membranifera]
MLSAASVASSIKDAIFSPTVFSRNASTSFIVRKNIGIFGRMNAGKSTLMNNFTQQQTSIVDDTPGTTADVKQALIEFHKMGPVKLFDTAGLDENGPLGDKKRWKTESALLQSDLCILVVHVDACVSARDCSTELDVLSQAKARNKPALVIFNVREGGMQPPADLVATLKQAYPALNDVAIDLHSANAGQKLIHHIEETYNLGMKQVSLLPDVPNSDRRGAVFLNIPMDAETPGCRLLRPQAFTQEQALSKYLSTVCYRMDLGQARGPTSSDEQERFYQALNTASNLRLLVTDSQAMDVVYPWTKGMDLPMTTFSTAMINFMSGGRLPELIAGLEALHHLKPGDKVLICEACNHDRLTENCEDIGLTQLPRIIKRMATELSGVPGEAITIEHSFGRVFPRDDVRDYALVVHCGACMLDQQATVARLDALAESGVPVTNYGLLLSYAQKPDALKRVIAPYGLDLDKLVLGR